MAWTKKPSRINTFRYFKKRIAADEALVDPGVREVDAFENDKGWYTKTARGFAVETIENIKGELTDYYDFIEKIRTKHGSLYHLYKLLTPHLYHLSLLNEIKEEFRPSVTRQQPRSYFRI